MEQAGWPEARVREALARARSEDLDFARGEILGSMCTEPHEVAQAAYGQFLPTNLGDPAHFPGTARLEREVLADVAVLAGSKAAGAARLLTGGTEANVLACYIAREQTGRDRIVVSEAGHFSFDKAARLLRMERVVVPAGADQRSDAAAMAEAVDDRTALVVAVAGSTELGLVDDVPAIAAAASAAGARCHVDAAFGGYVLPFLGGAPPWNLAVAGVSSVAIDPHKMGMAAIPAGALVTRDASDWQATAVETSYVSTPEQSTLMGTRPGAAAAAIWATHKRLGTDGYRDVVAGCITRARRLAAGLQARGLELVAPPELNVVTFRCDDPVALRDRLVAGGHRLNVVPRFGALRIVCGPHVTEATVDAFFSNLEHALA